ncbi:MAG: hypothetical protein BWK80_02710 [Desulfobacteraceae bacterium IS3]|nr:MAG: hypothetical protein BWK80_02710 [Desulfobacteraceae bacterium IS3]
MFKFIHAADIHLDSPLLRLEQYGGAPADALCGATRRAFENLVRLAINQHVDFMLISGDLYDGDWKDYNTGLYFVSQMSKLREAEIPVFIIAGNHDAESRMTKTLRLPENVSFFSADRPETKHIDKLGVAVHGQSFPTRAVKKDMSAAYPSALPGYFNIGMLHTCAQGREGHEPYAPCTVESLRSKDYDYWALGHVHQSERLCEEPMILFPGNIQGRHIRESGPKGCMIVTVADKGQADADFHALDVIRWKKLRIDAKDCTDRHEVIERICEQLESLTEQNEGLPVIARMEVFAGAGVHSELAGDMAQWTNEIRATAIDSGGDRLWVEKVRVRKSPEILTTPADWETSKGAMGELLCFFDEIRSDPAQLKSLAEPLNELWKKLPSPLREGQDALALNDAEWLTNVLDEVQSLLIRRLTSKGDIR